MGAAVAFVAACIPLIGGLFALDARYEKAEDAKIEREALVAQASEKHFHQDKEREEGDLRTRLNLINNRIDFLTEKANQTPDDVNEIDYLKEQRAIILKRLNELEQAA